MIVVVEIIFQTRQFDKIYKVVLFNFLNQFHEKIFNFSEVPYFKGDPFLIWFQEILFFGAPIPDFKGAS